MHDTVPYLKHKCLSTLTSRQRHDHGLCDHVRFVQCFFFRLFFALHEKRFQNQNHFDFELNNVVMFQIPATTSHTLVLLKTFSFI